MQQQHGSGKTAVLVERIINKIINENIDIDKLLVVTFTNAAASEMRERILDAIYKKIDENPDDDRLQKQVILLNKASICTIDSFCLDVIKNNFYEIDISPNFRIADTAEINLLKQDVLEEMFEDKYEEHDINFEELIKTYTSYRDDTPLKDLILKIYDYIQSNPFPVKWLNEKTEIFNLKNNLNIDFAKTIWGEKILQEIDEELIDNITLLIKAKMILSKYPELDKFERTIDSDIEKLEELKNNLDSWDKAFEISKNIKFNKWPSDKKIVFEEKEIAKIIRDSVKKKMKSKIDKILAFDSKDANQDIFEMYNIITKLRNIILEFEQRFSALKKERNILDFNDIEHFALKILLKEDENGNIIPTEVAKMYQNRFSEIAIDEYQDSNLVQESILNAIQKNNNFFMVGDVKQSIYRFRQARPELFLEKYKLYKFKDNKKDEDNLKIQLFKNFRSRKNILDFTNLIFENIMSNVLGDIEYNEEEYLNLGAKYEELSKQDFKTEINIINLKESENENEDTILDENGIEETKEILENSEIEARFVSKKIKEIIDSHKQIFDLKRKSFRDITFKDIVILLRTTKDIAPIYEKELINLGMPVFCDSSAEYLDSIEIQTIMSVLKIIDNPLNEIALITVLRSSIGGFTDNDLVQIRLSDKYSNFYYTLKKSKINVDNILRNKIEKFLSKIDNWRKEKEYLGLDELIWKIYTETGYYYYVGLMPNGNLRQANLKKLFERAKQYESASFKGLFNFIKFIEKLQISSGDLGSAKLIGENENVIRIMSIHKSKGLEFPVVFLSGTGKQFNFMDLNSNILLHNDMGFGVKYINHEKQIEYDTLSKLAMKNQLLQDTLSEEMRILYVAQTRAKEKLFITATSKDYKKELEDLEEKSKMYKKSGKKINPILIKKCKRFIDWIILTSLYDKDEFNKIATINTIKKEEIKKSETEETNINALDILENYKNDSKNQTKIIDLMEYQYPYKLSIGIPTKTSVTRIKELKSLEEEFNNPSLDDILLKNESNKEEMLFVPDFIKEEKDRKISSAQLGTLIHLCMQRLDYKRDYNITDIRNLISELQAKNIISEKEATAINENKILKFTKSIIWKYLKEAKEVYQEKPFYINIKAGDIYNNKVNETILVQGIIDLYYIDKNDNLILVDYKTDFIEKGKEEELVNKYKEQLILYSKALQQSINKKPFKIYIYSTCLDKAIEVKP